MYDIVTLGEILIDFSPDGFDDRGFAKYIRNPGGAVANVAAVLGKYGSSAALIGKVGNDLFGKYLKQVLTDLAVDCRAVFEDETFNTTLAFVSLDHRGDRSFSFYRKNEADIKLRKDELPNDILTNTRIFHFGSLSLTDEPARSATYAALDIAREANALISFDPNYRESLWAGQDAGKYIRSVLNRVDFIKVSLEEGEMITGKTSPEEIANELLQYGCKFAAVTLGAQGAYYANEMIKHYAAPYTEITTIDTTGARDIFWGTVLYEYLTHTFDHPELVQRAIERAAIAAGLCTEHKGAIPSIPDYSDVINRHSLRFR